VRSFAFLPARIGSDAMTCVLARATRRLSARATNASEWLARARDATLAHDERWPRTLAGAFSLPQVRATERRGFLSARWTHHPYLLVGCDALRFAAQKNPEPRALHSPGFTLRCISAAKPLMTFARHLLGVAPHPSIHGERVVCWPPPKLHEPAPRRPTPMSTDRSD
jgi:hypothetical protein